MTLLQAKAKYLRISPKKVDRVLEHIRGKDVAEAMSVLKFIPNSGARYVEKV